MRAPKITKGALGEAWTTLLLVSIVMLGVIIEPALKVLSWWVEILPNLVDEDFSSGVFSFSVNELNTGDHVWDQG